MKTQKIKISYPNDYGSDDDYQAAIEECGESEEAILDRISEPARNAGLEFIKATDYGAIWQGSKNQIDVCKKDLPDWAYYGEIEEE